MSFIPLTQGRHHCSVFCIEADQGSIARYLSEPKRPMAALLNRQRMECRCDGTFFYRSRPFQLLRFEIKPEVVFTTVWSKQELLIVFQHIRIQGLGPVEQAIRFSCEAVLQPCTDGLKARVSASLLMDGDHPLALVPVPLRRRLADQALQLVFDRLERRCQGGLKRSLNRWLVADASPGESSSECE